MKYKIFGLAFVCLLIGGVIGYQLKEFTASEEASSKDHDLNAKNATAMTAGSLKAKAEATEKKSKAESSSLEGRLQALLENYDPDTTETAIQSLSEADIQSALGVLAAAPKSENRYTLRSALYGAWARINPLSAWQAALTDPLDYSSGSFLRAVVGEIAKTQPEKAADLAMSLGADARRPNVFDELFREWSKLNLTSAVAYLNKHPDLPIHDWAVANAISYNWQKDPHGTANSALTLIDQNLRSKTVSTVMSKWAENDPTAALAWAQNLTSPALRESAIDGALKGWSYKNPVAAMKQAQAITDPKTRSSSIQTIWQMLLRKDAKAAMTILGSLNAEDNQLSSMCFNFAYNADHITQQEKLTLIEKLPAGLARQKIISGMAESQIQKGRYNQAMALLNDLPDSMDRDGTVQQLGKRWAESDLNAAAEWLKLQPDSSDRDFAVTGFASVLARTDPEGALKWARTIPDKLVRTSALQNIAMNWLAADPIRAKVWLNGVTELTESEKQSVLVGDGFNRSFSSSVSNRR